MFNSTLLNTQTQSKTIDDLTRLLTGTNVHGNSLEQVTLDFFKDGVPKEIKQCGCSNIRNKMYVTVLLLVIFYKLYENSNYHTGQHFNKESFDSVLHLWTDSGASFGCGSVFCCVNAGLSSSPTLTLTMHHCNGFVLPLSPEANSLLLKSKISS